MNRTREVERWVNAEFTVIIPLDISPDASKEEKMEAMMKVFDKRFDKEEWTDTTISMKTTDESDLPGD